MQPIRNLDLQKGKNGVKKDRYLSEKYNFLVYISKYNFIFLGLDYN